MFNGQYLEIEGILRDVRKYPFMEGLTKREAAHSLVNLLSLVGARMPMVKTFTNVKIISHKGELPKDIIYIQGVNNKGSSCSNKGIPMRYASDIYHSALHADEVKRVKNGINITTPEQVAQIYPPTLPEGEDIMWGELVSAPARLSAGVPVEFFENSYNINGMSIDTSFPNGYVEIAYDAVKTDEEGYPMIPDDISFREAYKYFLLKNAAEPAYYRGDVAQHVYSDINTQYSWYVGQAFSSLTMLSPDQAESMANGLLRIVSSQHNYKDGWKGHNKPQ
jgi:hypothetical protein